MLTGSGGTRFLTSSSSAGVPEWGASDYAEQAGSPRGIDSAEVQRIVGEALAPFSRESGESPYEIQHDLQETMQTLVGIIRTESELQEALVALDKLDDRAQNMSVSGGRAYNPGWNLATDLPAMLTVSRMVTMGAINRKESRGGHTRDDYPGPVPDMGKVNFVQRLDDTGKVTVTAEERPPMPPELQELLEDGH